MRGVIQVAARLRGCAAAVVDREIELCGLSEVAGRFVSHLSGGERQRVGLAVTFLADVPVFIFDEPSASLDPASARILIERALERREECHVDCDSDGARALCGGDAGLRRRIARTAALAAGHR